jgi:tetratricopeptide (TPR) repeat protein
MEAKGRIRRADGLPSLGLAMIVKNEAQNLPYSLGPLAPYVEQAVCVDTGSGDDTAMIAAGYGAEVYRQEWSGDFSEARNRSLERMRTDHVMWLDADNSLSLADLGLIRDKLSGGPQIIVATEVVVPQGDKLWQKRVFFNSPEVRFQGTVHEQLSHPADWPVIVSPAQIRHWGYADAASARRKGQRNLELLISAPETAAGDFYHLYQTGRTLFNLRFLAEAEDYLLKAALGREKRISEDSAALLSDIENPSLWSHALILIAQARSRQGKLDGAEAALRFLVRTRPDYGPARAALGKHLYESSLLREAAVEMERALALGCGDPGWGADPVKMGFQTACQLAKANERLGRTSEAFRAWKAASRLDPDHPEPYVAMAETSMAGGDRSLAKELISVAISLAPAHRRALSLSVSLEAGL